MKKIFTTTIVIAWLAMFVSSVEAVITIETATTQSGAAFIKGKNATKGAQIFWEGALVTTANKNNGGFSFLGILPTDCIGTLSDGGAPLDVTVLGCTPPPVSQSSVLKTGQTTSFATGDDGDFQAGVTVPNPRFTDNGDGTVTDNLAGLTWPQDLDCVGGNVTLNWAAALAAANALADGNVACGLSDGSGAGDWRLPNRNELASLLDLGTISPALPAGHLFVSFVASSYWSSTTVAGTSFGWTVNVNDGNTGQNSFTTSSARVTAVRGGL